MKSKLRMRFHLWDCYVQFSKYIDGKGTVIQLYDVNDNELVITATVNLPNIPVPPGHVLIKDYSENAGILEALIEAEIISYPVGLVPIGHTYAQLCKLLVNPEDYQNDRQPQD